MGSRFIVGGDYNAKHTFCGLRLIITKKRDLLKSANEIKAQFILTRKSAYWPANPNKLPYLFDFCVTKSISSNYTEIEGLKELTSDFFKWSLQRIILIISYGKLQDIQTENVYYT